MPSVADFIDAVAALMPSVPVRLGEEYIQENVSPPNVVFVPRDDTYGAPRAINRTVHPSFAIATRVIGLEVRIWGAAAEGASSSYPDLRATELLLDKVISAIRKAGQGSVRFEAGEWAPTSLSQLGRLYVLRIRVDMPVIPNEEDEPNQTTTFTEVLSPDSPAAIETTFEFPSRDETGTPSL